MPESFCDERCTRASGKSCDIDFKKSEDELGVDPEERDAAILDLEDRLNAVAPPGVYFGAHHDDGADFGFWKEDQQ